MTQEQGLNFITLQVESVEIKDNRVVVKAGGRSHSFFQTKKSGEPSRAQDDYLRLGVRAGQTYSFGISESQGVNSQTGQPVTYRNIGVISEAQEQAVPIQNISAPPQNVSTPQPYVPTPSAPSTTHTHTPMPPAPAVTPTEIEVQKLTNRITSLENRVALLEPSKAEINDTPIPEYKEEVEQEVKVEDIPFG